MYISDTKPHISIKVQFGQAALCYMDSNHVVILLEIVYKVTTSLNVTFIQVRQKISAEGLNRIKGRLNNSVQTHQTQMDTIRSNPFNFAPQILQILFCPSNVTLKQSHKLAPH